MDLVRRAILERLMNTLFVVEGEILAEAGTRLRDVPVVLEVHLLVLEAAPEALDEDVVEGPAPPIHAQAHLGRQERGLELGAGELHALVGVEDLRLLALQHPR